MLKIFRQKNVTKLVLWGILILILPAFVLWGTGSGGRSKDDGPKFVGLIDNNKITFSDFAKSLVSIRAQIILNYFSQPKIMDALMNSKEFLGKLAWDRLLMDKAARKANIKISNDEVVKFIKSHPIFMKDGVFNDRMYSYILKNSMGLDPRTFEELVRNNLEIQRFNDQLTKDIKVDDQEIVKAYERDNDKIKISYILFSPDSFVDKAEVSDSQVRDYYDQHKDELTPPAKEKTVDTAVTFESAREGIRKLLSQERAGELARQYADEQHANISELMSNMKLSFEEAAVKSGLTPKESALFSRGEYIEDVGEAGQVVDAATELSGSKISRAVSTRKGIIIFRVSGNQKFDEEKFKKEKDDFTKNVLEAKKTKFLEDWLRGMEAENKVIIDFKDYEKYYR